MHQNSLCPVGACPECLDTRDPFVWSGWLTRQSTGVRAANASRRTFRASAPRDVPPPPSLEEAFHQPPTSREDRLRDHFTPHGSIGPVPAETLANVHEGMPSPSAADFAARIREKRNTQ